MLENGMSIIATAMWSVKAAEIEGKMGRQSSYR